MSHSQQNLWKPGIVNSSIDFLSTCTRILKKRQIELFKHRFCRICRIQNEDRFCRLDMFEPGHMTSCTKWQPYETADKCVWT